MWYTSSMKTETNNTDTRNEETTMSNEARKAIETELANLKTVKAGGEVEGVRIGSAGIDAEWVAQAIETREELLKN